MTKEFVEREMMKRRRKTKMDLQNMKERGLDAEAMQKWGELHKHDKEPWWNNVLMEVQSGV